VRFLVDRCAGHRVAEWLRAQGHDCLEARSFGGPDPGDRALLDRAATESRILVTIDTDFGALVFRERAPHAGVIRLPDVPATTRIALLSEVLARFRTDLERSAIVTVRGSRVMISRQAP
jgi:predicted nuclease of predicted toxin-antitoxin system